MTADENTRYPDCPPPPRFISDPEIESYHIIARLQGQSFDVAHEEDARMFKLMNALGFHMDRLWRRKRRMSVKEKARYQMWYAGYLTTRESLTHRHVGLVYGLMRKCRYTTVELDELRSEGLMALIRSVDSFNPWRGFRFSTYACNAILRAFSQAALKISKRQHVWMTTVEYDGLESGSWLDDKRREDQDLMNERLRRILDANRAELSSVERLILEKRFGPEKKTSLQELGRTLNLSKERVRQIQQGSLEKLRDALLEDPVVRGGMLDGKLG